MNTGDRIKQLRIQKQLSQEELGRIVGVQKSAIAKYESGRVKNPKRSTIEQLADSLDTTPAYLMCWTNNMQDDLLTSEDAKNAAKLSLNKKLLSYYVKLGGLSEDQQNLIYNMIEQRATYDHICYMSGVREPLQNPISK